MDASTEYDPRYLAGIVLFNRGDYFEAHEVWEQLWMDCASPEKKFYQGLIQAAVALCHFCNGNVRGARKLYQSSKEYMNRFGSPFMGLDNNVFWDHMGKCFAELLAAADPNQRLEPDENLLPTITVSPEPTEWPDPQHFLDESEPER
jgi:predicted metal-dependent hydrolase